uniref:Uncharacterized protein n=1 Tax=Arundo donax TaxID=35708 RepID=A0A0A9DFJ8_ARUDO
MRASVARISSCRAFLHCITVRFEVFLVSPQLGMALGAPPKGFMPLYSTRKN